MRTTGGAVRVAISVVILMLASACAATPSEEVADAKGSTATTGTTVDLFATTQPDLSAVVPTTDAIAATTEAPPAPSTTVDESHRSRVDGLVPGVASVPPEFGSSGLLWIGTWLGYSEIETDVKFVLAPDGSVLRINQGNIYSGAGSYLTWNIGPDGYSAVVELISELGLESDRLDRNLQGQSGEIRTDGSFSVRIDMLNASSGDLTAEQREMRKNFRQLMARLDDNSWLEDITTVTQRAPWVPDRVAMSVRDEYNPIYYSTEAFAWPFDESIRDMATSGDGLERWICLEGADAETAWNTFMIDGVNNARLPLEADGQLWEAGVRVSHAMYGGISPCQGATGFGTGSNERVSRADLSELFLDADDVSEAWTVTAPVITPPSPNIENCSPITDAEIAVDEFDSWLSHTADLELRGTASQFQMLGEVPAGVDAVSVIEQVGTHSCLDGLGQFGVIDIESGMLDDPPPGVTAAAVWILTYDGGAHQVVIDAVLDNGLAMAFGMTASIPLELADLEPHFLLAVDKATAG